ncbi:MAG TPA: AMP-binding protein [Mycobacteriales bacterium]|nr:AMP-binding protein [Mycobacteriales bacterium]
MTAPVPSDATAATIVLSRADDAEHGLRFEGAEIPWRDVVADAQVRAALLTAQRRGGPPHVALLLENVPEMVYLLAGCALSGSVGVLVNSTRRGDELARDVRATDCELVITDAAHAALLDGLDLGAADGHVLTIESDTYAALLADHADAPPPASLPGERDLFLLLFTSGSTGAPKAVKVSQARAARTGGMGFRSKDVLYCSMPLFHGNALFSCLFPALGSGATLVLRRRFSASAFIPDIRAHGATFANTVGRALSYVLATPPADDDRDHRLKVVLGPESSPVDVAAFEQRFGCLVVTGYGSSENAVILVPAPGAPRDALGVPAPGQDIAVVDPETGQERPRARFDDGGRLVNADEAIGEIVGRNALERFEGYYNNDEATNARVRNGWYWSGDLGYRDEAGVFFFAGRTADWLRVDGENFAAGPVERVVLRAPGVSGAVVFGVPDERTVDDQVMAVLEVADPASFDVAAFEGWLREQRDLGTKWMPRYVRLLTALPVGATDKVDRTPLRAMRWDAQDVWWRPQRGEPLAPMSDADRAELVGRFERNGRASALSR